VRSVEVTNITPPQALHHGGYRAMFIRRCQQVNVVRHENPGMNPDVVPFCCLFEPLAVDCEIRFTNKANLPIIASLNDVLGNPGRANTQSAGHVFLLELVAVSSS